MSGAISAAVFLSAPPPLLLSAQDSATVINTVFPGLIDAHTHLLTLEHPKGNISTEGITQVNDAKLFGMEGWLTVRSWQAGDYL